MTDDLRTRIIEVQLSHIPIDYAGGIECACGTECQPRHGGIDVAEQMWADHVADAVIGELRPQLAAWARMCVDSGDMTPMARRMLHTILGQP